MRQKKLTYLVLAFTLSIFFSTNLFSQERSDLPGEPVLNNSTENIEEPEMVYPDNVKYPNLPTEYGSNHFNYNLTNTNSSSNHVIIPHSSNFSQSADGTIEMWIYAENLSHVSELISKGATTTSQFIFGINSPSGGSRLYFRLSNTPIINDDGDSIRLNVWTHVAVTWTISGGNATVDFYVNGNHSGTQKVVAASWTSNTDDVYIGGGQYWTGEYFEGKIDEVRIWDPDLTQNQIATNRFIGIGTLTDANTSSAITGGDQYTGLIASWTFNESSGVYDYIGGHNGTYNGTATNEQSVPGQPIPYNLAMYFPGSDSNYISIPDNTIFEQSGAGSLEAWIKITDLSSTRIIASKGGSDFRWQISTAIGNKQRLVINGTFFSNDDGIEIKENVWTHVAVTWNLSTDDVDFYVNGQKSGSTVTHAVSWTSNSEPFMIGSWSGGGSVFVGYIDEMRLWDPKLTLQEIQYNMNVSGTRLLSNTDLEACWNFEGHLRNITSTTGVDGTLDNGGVNNCRFSGFSNESSSGSLTTGFTSHPTVLYYGSLEDDFRKSYPNAVVKDAPIVDSIYVPTSGAVTNVELFVHIQHDYTLDVDITLTAPNGTTTNVASDQVGVSNGYLTVFEDGATNTLNGGTPVFRAPFSNHVQPEVLFGNMGGTDKQGWWKISVDDDVVDNDTGRFISWGLCINNSTEVEDIVQGPYEYKLSQNYPNPFNPTTKIEYSIANAGLVELKIYNILGEEITTLVNEIQNPGKHTIEFNGIDLSSGVYFYRITSGKFTEVKKMILMK